AAGARKAGRDLGGTWTHASYTNLERPPELKALVMSAAEIEAYEAPRRAQGGMPPSKPGEVGQAESEFNERGDGVMRVRGEARSSLIIDPPDGRVPFRPEVLGRIGVDRPPTSVPRDGPEQRALTERCLSSAASGAPMIPGADANVFQFVQTPAALAIVCEKYHEVRIIPIGAPLPQRLLPSWPGTSAGRWEGDTLVVETAGFHPGVSDRGQRLVVSDATRVVERFTRTGPAEILYVFDVTDPVLFSRSWRGEAIFRPAKGLIYEYACHEGNYALADILAIARHEEAAKGGP
ncbi:MAG TPA: hypothetical protein VF495_01920, partial [Phenylobacterium sp.]